MRPDTSSPSPAPGVDAAVSRCPACAAAVRPGAPWCTQCYGALGGHQPQPGPPSAPAAVPVVLPETAVQTQPADDPAWPCTACGARNPLDATACGPCGTPFLAGLRETEPPLLVLPGVGDVGALPRAQRLGLAAGAVLAVLVLVLLLGLLG